MPGPGGAVRDLIPLGRRLYQKSFVLLGTLAAARWLEFMRELTLAIGMTPHAAPAVYNYPSEGGKGGVGQTIFQPITESFIALDTWPDHVGSYLLIASCKPFDRNHVRIVAERFGLNVDSERVCDLGIP